MMLGSGENATVTRQGDVVTRRPWRPETQKNTVAFARALKMAPAGLAPTFISYHAGTLSYRYVPGKTPTQLTEAHIRLHLNNLARLHAKTFDNVGSLARPRSGRFSLVQHLQKEWHAYAKEAFREELKEHYERIHAIIRKKDALFTRRRTRLIHGDCGLTNMLIHKNTITYIDWEGAAYGDPAEDLAAWYMIDVSCKPWRMTITRKQEEIYLEKYRDITGDRTIMERTRLFRQYILLADTLFLTWKVQNFAKEHVKVISRERYARMRNDFLRLLRRDHA